MSESPDALEIAPAEPQVAQRHPHAPRAPQQFLRTGAICGRLGIERHTWRRWVVAGQAPAPVPNVPGRPRWRVRDVEDFERGLYRAGRWRRRDASVSA